MPPRKSNLSDERSQFYRTVWNDPVHGGREVWTRLKEEEKKRRVTHGRPGAFTFVKKMYEDTCKPCSPDDAMPDDRELSPVVSAFLSQEITTDASSPVPAGGVAQRVKHSENLKWAAEYMMTDENQVPYDKAPHPMAVSLLKASRENPQVARDIWYALAMGKTIDRDDDDLTAEGFDIDGAPKGGLVEKLAQFAKETEGIDEYDFSQEVVRIAARKNEVLTP